MKTASICGLLAAVSVLALGLGLPHDAQAQPAPAGATAPELAAQGVWDPAKTYAKDDIVTARGSAWISLKAANTNKVPGQTQPSTATYWQLFARGFNPAGAWSNAALYQPDDLVTRLGQTYRAKITNLNKQPPHALNWELFAAKGEPGPNTGVGAGTASEPSISFNGDTSTGIYSPGTGKIALVENGTAILHTGAPGTSDNTAVGKGALESVQGVGSSNTAVGAFALADLTTGQNNVGIGRSALGIATIAADNVAIGNQAMSSSSTASQNTAIGQSALVFNTSGSNNVAIGYAAARATNVGTTNVAVGHSSLFDNTSGNRNVALGRGALENNTTGNDNIAIGDQAGTSASVTGSNNIFIGHSGSGFNNNALVIGGPQTTTQIAGIHSATSASGIAVLINASGRLGTTTSSRRFKQDIETMPGVADMLAKLRPVSFRYKQAEEDGSRPLQYGLIAEEVEAVKPDLVAYDKDGNVHTVKYHLLPNFLLAGYQAQQKTIDAQAEKIEALEDRLRRLEALLPQTKAAALQ